MFSVGNSVTYEEQIRKSRFIGHLCPVKSADEAKALISIKATTYRDASHNCWAYIIGIKGELYHFSDAGEPSGTAGKPILTALQRNNLSNVVLIVTRYFGGVKLGIRGLIEAYRKIAEETISQAQLKEIILKDFFEVITDYASAEKLKYDLQEMNSEIHSIDYQKEVTMFISAASDSILKEFLIKSQNAGLLRFHLLKTGLDFC
jgi:uncharacterized YigZ family protein